MSVSDSKLPPLVPEPLPRFSEKDYDLLLNLVISRAPLSSKRVPMSEEEHDRLLQLMNSLDKQLHANRCVSTGESEKADYGKFLLWQNLSHYLFRQGWSLGDLTNSLMYLKR